jgi:hypothetical protein
MLGKVTKVADSYITVEIAAGTEVVVQKPSITLVLPKGHDEVVVITPEGGFEPPFLLLKATMNRYPLWKYIIVAVALVLGFVYTLPNFFGESPAVQVSSAKATIKVDDKAKARAEEALIAAAVVHA